MTVDPTRASSTPDSPTISEQREYWDARWTRTPQPNAWQARRGEVILRMLRPHLAGPARILDLGCGTGWFAGVLGRLGETTAVDLSPAAIAIAQRSFPHVTFIAGDLFRMTWPRHHFDVVVSQEVIAHVPDQPRYVEIAADALRAGGHLVLTTVNKFVIERTPQPPDPREHIKQWLDMPALRRLLGDRFEILASSTAIPMGTQGVLRIVNAHTLNRILEHALGPDRLTALKEWAGLGYTRLILARKRP